MHKILYLTLILPIAITRESHSAETCAVISAAGCIGHMITTTSWRTTRGDRSLKDNIDMQTAGFTCLGAGLLHSPWALATIYCAKMGGRLLDLHTQGIRSSPVPMSLTAMSGWALGAMALYICYSKLQHAVRCDTTSIKKAIGSPKHPVLNKRRATLVGTMCGIGICGMYCWTKGI